MNLSKDAEKFLEELIWLIKPNEIDDSSDRRKKFIIDMISEAAGGRRGGGPGNVNFYPSDYKGGCYDKAFFVSLKGKRWNIHSRQRLKFDDMFQSIIAHCQGSCPGQTREVYIICDNWEDDVVDMWKRNIETIQRNDGTVFNVFVITGSKIATGTL